MAFFYRFFRIFCFICYSTSYTGIMFPFLPPCVEPEFLLLSSNTRRSLRHITVSYCRKSDFKTTFISYERPRLVTSLLPCSLFIFSITSEKSNYQITPTTFIVLSHSTTHMFCPSVRPLCSFVSRGILVKLGNKLISI